MSGRGRDQCYFETVNEREVRSSGSSKGLGQCYTESMQQSLEAKHFQKRTEDFVCAHCQHVVVGSGYTNHCPSCLYSQHVDVNPGDRAAHCGGLMEPVGIEPFGQSWKILHRCLVCRYERKNKVLVGDNFDAILGLQQAANRKRFYTSR